MRLLKNLVALCCIYSITLAAYPAPQDKLIFAVDVIRHGDRTPTKNIPTVSYQWPEGLGQLTPTGMQQEYQLGAKQHFLYIETYHLLPEHYTPGTIQIRSSDFDRTLMSAQSFLAGLYPLGTGPQLPGATHPALPSAQQVIPVHTVPVDEETLLIPDNAFYKFDTLLEKYVFPTADWKQKTAEYQAKFPVWSQITGINITALQQVVGVGDALYIDELYHVPLPAGLSHKDAQELIALSRWVFVNEFKDPAIGSITGQRLLQTIAENLQQASEQKSALKYMLFSAHDSTLLAQLSALGVPVDEAPHYASHLNFALYDQGNGGYFVQVTYNDLPVVIPSCGSVCTLQQFVKLANLDKINKN